MINQSQMEAAAISEKGLRPEMEDTHFLDTDFANQGWVYGGVYDGHGGNYAAEYTARRMHQVFLEELMSGTSPGEAFVQSYETVSLELRQQNSGTTAVDFFIRDRMIYVANAGDARALVVGREGFRQLTTDHRLDNAEERARIKEMGGHIADPYTFRENLGLMPTRTIGDQFFKSVGIISTPSLAEYEISPDDLVLLAACDGLFDFVGNGEVASIAREHRQLQTLLAMLQEEAFVNHSGTDNLTIVAVALQQV